MKKACILASSGLFLFVFCILAEAASVGSPASILKKGQWVFGLEGNFLSDRALELNGSSTYELKCGQGFHMRGYGLTDRISIYGKVGFGDLEVENTSTNKIDNLHTGFAGGLKIKGLIFEEESLGIEMGVGAQFFYLYAHRDASDTDWLEWQLSSYVSKEIWRLKPYAGVKFSWIELDFEIKEEEGGDKRRGTYEEDDLVGLFVGTDLYFGEDKAIFLNAEAGFITGNEFTIGLNYRF